MALYKIDDFWKIFEAVAGLPTSVTGVTDAVDATAKAERTRSESLFNNVVDQSAYDTEDYDRIRKLFIDLYSTHKALTTSSASLSDPHSMPNTHLDELFRSFGYNHSVTLKDFDENPLPGKVNLFLDLVNLYKRKGTPQSIVDVLQYYGISELDVYEFMLKFDDKDKLIFEGRQAAGTTENPTTLRFFWPEFTRLDPHWLLTESQIRQLNARTHNNLPAKTPYFGVQPVANADGPEIAILVRLVQDQYALWRAGGTPPVNANITILGENSSLLDLYLACIYTFEKLYNVGVAGPQFACYDGTTEIVSEIITEFDDITRRPTTRNYDTLSDRGILTGLSEYYDQFTRVNPRNFLQSRGDAAYFLNLTNPTMKAGLDGLGEADQIILFTLLKDLAIWVRNNLGYGFVNLGFIMFGLDAFFADLFPVVNFFKPYRARLILLEALQIKNRLFNTIIVEDSPNFYVDTLVHDFLTADSVPCCNEDTIDSTDSSIVCLDSTSGLHYSRDTYDCGSYHDLGAVTDMPKELFIEETYTATDRLRCYQCPDSTTIVNCQNCSDYPEVVPPDNCYNCFQYGERDCLSPLMDGDGFVDGFYLEGNANALPPVQDQEDAENLDSTSDVIYVTTGGMANFDEGASFDCTHGFDQVEIHFFEKAGLLQETGGNVLLEDGGLILLD